MGIFSRKPKTPRPLTKDSASFDSDNSHNNISIGRSSHNKSVRSNTLNFVNSRTSASSLGGLQSPLTPMTPHMPKINLPKPPDPSLDAAGYLRSLGAVRERSKVVTEKALQNQLNHFDVDLDKFPDVVQFVCRIIKVRMLALLARLPSCLFIASLIRYTQPYILSMHCIHIPSACLLHFVVLSVTSPLSYPLLHALAAILLPISMFKYTSYA